MWYNIYTIYIQCGNIMLYTYIVAIYILNIRTMWYNIYTIYIQCGNIMLYTYIMPKYILYKIRHGNIQDFYKMLSRQPFMY